jgi:hypothetical protein
MTLEQFRDVMDKTPFQPFVIHMADGRSLPVVSREYIMSSPTGRTVAVYKPDGVCSIIDLLLVNELEVQPANGAKQRRKR